MEIFDISRALSDETAPWPGDTAFHFELKWKMADGATVNVGAITMGVHNGTHADATLHFDEGGDPIEHMPLEAVAASLEQAPRLLLKTGIWKDSSIFPDWIPVIAPDVPAWLRERRVRLLGLDLPSVDPIEAKKLANHHALAAAGIAILESLNLNEVEAGVYHFSALPLKITGGDAGPVRAILWRD